MGLFTEVDDINHHIIILSAYPDTSDFLFKFDPKFILQIMLLDKKSYILVRRMPLYQDLIKLRHVIPKYAFGSIGIIQQYYQYGLVHLLEHCQYDLIQLFSFCSFPNHLRCIDWAAENGHVNVLNWHKKSGLPFIHSANIIYRISAETHVQVLDWWKKSFPSS